MGYEITISRDIACDITPDDPKTPGKNNFNENSPPCCGLRFALAPGLCLLALSPAWPFLSSFCCPPDGHIIGLTVPPANTYLVPSQLGLLPECMIVFVPVFCCPCLVAFSLLFYVSHGIGIEISQKYSRYRHRYRKETIAWYTEKCRYDAEY